MRPGKEGFDTERSRGVGGVTMSNAKLRFSQRDFKGRSATALARTAGQLHIALTRSIEREVGARGNRDARTPCPDGTFLPPVPPRSDDPKRAAARPAPDCTPARR